MYAILNLIIHVLYIYQYVCEKHKRYIAAVNLFIVPCEPTLCTGLVIIIIVYSKHFEHTFFDNSFFSARLFDVLFVYKRSLAIALQPPPAYYSSSIAIT